MARTNSAAVKPLVSRGYGKIIGLTFLAILAGCGLIAWELTADYDWQLSAPRPAAVKIAPLPPVERTAPPPVRGPGPAPVPPPGGPGNPAGPGGS
ncbi:MAG: hypothetical protein MUF18_09345 [Fimbriiglobus sp.]|jgi:hypothetical protein|nr:hypothetical protein [Fimbriiglobus sp.]